MYLIRLEVIDPEETKHYASFQADRPEYVPFLLDHMNTLMLKELGMEDNA